MIHIKKLSRPNKRSGRVLISGDTTRVRGVQITNTNPFTVYVDPHKPKSAKRQRRKVRT